jgi:prevent-host-death family protein
MSSIPISEARRQIADLANQVAIRGDRIVVERHGRGLMALVSMDDLELLERLEDEADLRAVRDRSGEPAESLAKVKKDLGT